MITFKQIAHFYFGGQAVITAKRNDNDDKKFAKVGAMVKIDGIFLALLHDGIIEAKLVARLLKDITIEEAAFCLKETYFDHVDYPLSDFKLELVGDEKQNPRISISNDWYTESLTFGNNTGKVWTHFRDDGSHSKISPVIFTHLLNLGFDLFNLIENEQAVIKSK